MLMGFNSGNLPVTTYQIFKDIIAESLAIIFVQQLNPIHKSFSIKQLITTFFS